MTGICAQFLVSLCLEGYQGEHDKGPINKGIVILNRPSKAKAGLTLQPGAQTYVMFAKVNQKKTIVFASNADCQSADWICRISFNSF